MNRLGNVIYYVKDVEATIAFFEKAFGLERAFVDPSGTYGQMETGDTALGFASVELAKENLSKGFREISKGELPGCEIALVSKNVKKALEMAVGAGAELIVGLEEKPWGQTVAYVRDPNGILIEIASEMCHSCSCH
jgi:catechol 2,3-dioxygenase-like lactoylglutathione lyase family enzyme